MKNKKIISLVLFIIGCLTVGAMGSFITIPAISTWYVSLNKSILTPPNYVFGPVWTTLYIFMAIAAWQIYILKQNLRTRKALVFFAIQLVLNFLWSYIFFEKHLLLLAFLEIILLWLTILVTLIKFYRLKSLAGLLMVPYLLWVSFAAYLTFAAWTLNS